MIARVSRVERNDCLWLKLLLIRQIRRLVVLIRQLTNVLKPDAISLWRHRMLNLKQLSLIVRIPVVTIAIVILRKYPMAHQERLLTRRRVIGILPYVLLRLKVIVIVNFADFDDSFFLLLSQ